MEVKISKEMAKDFYRELCKAVYGDSNKNSQGVMSIELIAEHMRVPYIEADMYCTAMIEHGITERQSGMIVV